jgi:hypothetical protein
MCDARSSVLDACKQMQWSFASFGLMPEWSNAASAEETRRRKRAAASDAGALFDACGAVVTK